MSNLETSVLHKHIDRGNRGLRRFVPLVTAAAVSTSLIVGVAGPASAAVRLPMHTAPISVATSDSDALPAASFIAAARYLHVSEGRFVLDTVDAGKAAISSQALSAASALADNLNALADREITTTSGVAIDVAATVPAAAQDTAIQVLPGITLTIGSSGIQLAMTKEAVTEVETVLGFGQNVAVLVGSILGAIPGLDLGGAIAGIVASSLGLANSFLVLCTASDGSATFSVPWFGLPSCSGLSLPA